MMSAFTLIALTLMTPVQADDTDSMSMNPQQTPMLAALPGQTNTGRLALQGKLEIDECRQQATDLIPDELDTSDPLLAMTPTIEKLSDCIEIAAHHKRLMLVGIAMLNSEQNMYKEGAWQRESISNVADIVGQEWAYFLAQEIHLTDTMTTIGFWSIGQTLETTRRNLRQHQR